MNLDELFQPVGIIGMMGQRMEGIRHADVIVGPVRAFADHDVGGDARQIGLIGNRDQIEQQPHFLIDRNILLGRGKLGRLYARKVAVLRELVDRRDRREKPCP